MDMEKEYSTLDELLDSEEFNNFMNEVEEEGYFKESAPETLEDTGRYPEQNNF